MRIFKVFSALSDIFVEYINIIHNISLLYLYYLIAVVIASTVKHLFF